MVLIFQELFNTIIYQREVFPQSKRDVVYTKIYLYAFLSSGEYWMTLKKQSGKVCNEINPIANMKYNYVT